jgi:hypothetical protein
LTFKKSHSIMVVASERGILAVKCKAHGDDYDLDSPLGCQSEITKKVQLINSILNRHLSSAKEKTSN